MSTTTTRWRRRTVTPADRAGTLRAASFTAVAGAVLFTVMLVGVLTHTGAQRLDAPVEAWFDAHRTPAAVGFMVFLAVVFGPTGMPIIVAVVTVAWAIARREVWRPVLLASGMLLGVATAEVLAPIVRHPRPPIGEMMLQVDHSFSFPSGHVLGTSDFFLLAAWLIGSRLGRPWLLRTLFAAAAVMVALQIVSRLFLGYHWLTDTLGSVGLSLLIVSLAVSIDVVLTTRVGERAVAADPEPDPPLEIGRARS
ncbi:phosphoesterase [Curtobacterium sp. 'Ferrero']|uniref:phosphatase PAP2 family protein n=1 Tax=Curtobacterium sp. 'Ferrero' TaxID=2033654 RepID=UPI000BD18250|nr:phosphatase PAP2 family protein [Curtobacterium sp. 'Ferrero']PCN48196.1 phosphoesterase [Curtobacterium sp. 'Ferrero']